MSVKGIILVSSLAAECDGDSLCLYGTWTGIITASMEAIRGRCVVGVACDGKRAIIVGGLTCASGGHEPLQLADVWEFHFAEECWVQARLYIICPASLSYL